MGRGKGGRGSSGSWEGWERGQNHLWGAVLDSRQPLDLVLQRGALPRRLASPCSARSVSHCLGRTASKYESD